MQVDIQRIKSKGPNQSGTTHDHEPEVNRDLRRPAMRPGAGIVIAFTLRLGLDETFGTDYVRSVKG